MPSRSGGSGVSSVTVEKSSRGGMLQVIRLSNGDSTSENIHQTSLPQEIRSYCPQNNKARGKPLTSMSIGLPFY